MKRLLHLGWLLLLPAVAGAVDIEVGSTRLLIPAPDGYALLTDEMQPYAGLIKRSVPPQNVQHALFVVEEDAAIAAKGQIPLPKRLFSVQSLRDLAYRPMTTNDFAQLKRSTRSENEQLAGLVEEKMPGLIRDFNEGVAKDYDIDVALSSCKALPFPPHFESDRALAFSMIVTYGMGGADGSQESFDKSVTMTLVHVRAKVICLAVAGPREEREWTRAAAREWTERILSANPSTGSDAEQERGAGFDWVEVVKYGIIGAVVAGLISAFAAVAKRRSARGG
jgi:hypothetical protein